MMEVLEKKNMEHLEELEELRLHTQHQSEIITILQCQICQKEKELERLHQAFEGGLSHSSVSKDDCSQCKEKDEKIRLLKEKLNVAMIKQHEAMNRALNLAERNQRLERELKDLDNMALAVEKECQSKVKQNLRSMDILQEKLRQKMDEIIKLEEIVMNMKNKMERDDRELDNLRSEKKLLERNLNLATNEKKSLNDKLNHFLIIEKNLTSEVSKLQEINKNLKQQIVVTEERVMDVLGTSCEAWPKRSQKPIGNPLGVSKSKTNSIYTTSTSKVLRDDTKSCCDDGNSDNCFYVKSNVDLLDKVQQERNFYHDECHRLKEILGNFQGCLDNDLDLMRQLKSQERKINDLKQETFALRRENCALMKRLEFGDHLSYSSGDSVKIILDRLEKERDMALSDISRLQGERDALKEKIKLAAETQIGEQTRLERIVMENEERIRRLESERKELISNQSSQRISLTAMEEKVDEYKEQVRNSQTELAQMAANYNQLKSLQEQTDRTLSDVQDHLNQTLIELKLANNKVKELEKEKKDLENEISVLQKEKSALKSSLTFMEKEKDGLLLDLDEKTEKVAKLENHIKKQDVYISDLVEKISFLEKKFEFVMNEKTSQEHELRTSERALEHLKEELEQCERLKEALVRENRRLQDDLAAAAKDCLAAGRDLNTEKQEVENLKKQLQQYVTEVKRAEELLTKKETERNQMLDHFRSLSLEATALETNNHTLESAVENTKTQLMSANNKMIDLEHQLSSKDSLLYSYEKQIADLTTQIAELETKLKQQTDLKIRTEADLTALRDLCSAIDSQKEALKRQANNHDAEKIQLMNEVRRLSEEYEGLNQKLSYERSLSQTLEKSLSNSRQETLEHKITNKDLQTEVQQLKEKLDELTQKLESESRDVRRYQSQCAELSQQVSELRREVINARFEQAKTMEDSRRLDCAVTPENEEEYCYSFSGSLPTTSRTFIRPPGEKRRFVFTTPSTPEKPYLPQNSSSNFSSEGQDVFWPRKFLQAFDDEDVKEIRFEPGILGRSARNVPPLIFPDDSDRTNSLHSNREHLIMLCGESENALQKLEWNLPPLLEKPGCGGETGTFKTDTISELSSLPEDSESKVDACTSEEKLTLSSAYPTYSVHKRSDSRSRAFDADGRVGELLVGGLPGELEMRNALGENFRFSVLPREGNFGDKEEGITVPESDCLPFPRHSELPRLK